MADQSRPYFLVWDSPRRSCVQYVYKRIMLVRKLFSISKPATKMSESYPVLEEGDYYHIYNRANGTDNLFVGKRITCISFNYIKNTFCRWRILLPGY